MHAYSRFQTTRFGPHSPIRALFRAAHARPVDALRRAKRKAEASCPASPARVLGAAVAGAAPAVATCLVCADPGRVSVATVKCARQDAGGLKRVGAGKCYVTS